MKEKNEDYIDHFEPAYSPMFADSFIEQLTNILLDE